MRHLAIASIVIACAMTAGAIATANVGYGPPAEEAAALERTTCGGAHPLVEEPRILSPQIVTEVRPLRDGIVAKAMPVPRMIGAQLRFGAWPALTAEWIERTLRCHEARQTIGAGPRLAHDPYWLPDSWVIISVQPDGDGYLINLRGLTPDAAKRILDHARAFAPEAVPRR